MSTEEKATSGSIVALFSEVGFVEDGPAKRPNRRGQHTREKLIQAAGECFTEYGYTRTRISDVVHRASTAQGNFYRHFNSLDDIFLAVLRPGLEEIAVASRSSSGGAADEKSLIEANTTYLHAYSRHRHILRLLREAAAASPNDGFQALWLRIRGDFVARTHRWLVRLAEGGEIADDGLDLLAESLGCLTEQLAYIHVGLPAQTPRRERIDELGEALGSAWHRLLPLVKEPT
ncbi:TetR/AcrR family transcriptional regulator [Gordonia sp. (in: high G+C Gram-positive bacteria)]|uniref:TetR/AcrR family transcriptional regulator n=1 Tax=Gordonia sp. (in: high G+C Gram-positive bacteria) TaxID=84139 RepID=UPI003F9CB728